MTRVTESARAVLLAALMVFSVFAGTVAFAGGAAGATTGQEHLTDQGTDAGMLSADETAVVQTIEFNDTDTNNEAVNLTAVNVTANATNTVPASAVANVSILNGSDSVLATTAPDGLFGDGQTIDISDVMVADGATATLKVEVSIAEDAAANGTTLALKTAATFEENGTVNETSFAVDSAPETLETTTPGLASAATLDTNGDDAIEAVNVTFTEDVAAASVDAGDFSLSSGDVDSVDASVGDGDDAQLAVSSLGDIALTPLVTLAADSVTDPAGNTGPATEDAVTATNPSNLEILTPTTERTVQSGDLLDVSFEFTADAPSSPQSTTVRLVGPETHTYDVDVDSYTVGGEQSLTLDLDKPVADELADGAYAVNITVTNGSGAVDTVRTEPIVVVNDDAPTVSDVSLNQTADVAPTDSLNVTYDYEASVNAETVTVWVVDDDTVSEFSNGDFANATFARYEKSVDHGTVTDETVTVDLDDKIADNDDYRVFVTATDVRGQLAAATQAPSLLDVNGEQPHIETVEANAGSQLVTVQFNEDVVAVDGDAAVTRADFDFQNANGEGPTAIESVVAHGGDTVVLQLDAAVGASDLGTDTVSARANQLADRDGANARMVGTSAVALNDSTAPDFGASQISADQITTSNQDSYVVEVATTGEPTDVAVTLNGSSGTMASNSSSSVTGMAALTFDVSDFDDGEVTVNVTLTDAGGNDAAAEVTAVKDTVAPTLSVAAANPGASADATGKTTQVVAEFSEPVDPTTATKGAFELTNPDYAVTDTELGADADTVILQLNRSVVPSAIDNGSVVTLNASGVEDTHGYAATNELNLTDEDAGSADAPLHTPTVASLTAEPEEVNVTLTYDEVVEAGDGSDLTAANFTYLDGNGGSADGVDEVTQTGPQTVVVTLNESLNASDLAKDQLRVGSEEVFDTSGNAQAAVNLTFGIDTGLSVSSEGKTLTVEVRTISDISTALSGDLTVSEVNRELATLEGFGLEDRFVTSVSADDFSQVESGTYRATVEVPEQGMFLTSGTVNGAATAVQTAVDTGAPYPTGAVLLDVTSAAQLDDTRNTTRIRVLFNEPIVADSILPSDVSIEGFDGEIVAVQSAGPFGAVEIIAEGMVQTGTAPDVTIAGDSYTDLAGTPGEDGGDTVVHTDTIELTEGRNFVSVPAETGSLPISELDTSAIDAIYAYDAASESWDAYDPDAAQNDFTALEGGQGYIVVADSATRLPVNVNNVAGAESDASAAAPAPNQLSLTEGWNLVGHFEEYDQQVGTAFSSLSDTSLYTVLAHDPAEPGLQYESWQAGDFTSIERGGAYWVFVRSDEVYTAAPQNASST
jgi:surface glycoprotein (TIGR04207 family)